MRAFLFLLLAALAPCGYAAISYYEPDASDMWWNPNEPGWGVAMAMQYDTIFATFFVYAPDGRSRWYVSTMRGDGAPADVAQRFTGRLYETTGPVVTSGTFNASAVTVRDVGTAQFLYTRPNSGFIDYTVDGVTVSKQIQRETLATADITGEFYLNRVLRANRCGGPNTGREPSINEPGVMTVTRSGDAVQIAVRPAPPSTLACTYNGTASQSGRMSSVSGTYSCSDGSAGPFALTEIRVTDWGFMSRIFANVGGCNMFGHFGGTRTTAFEMP